MFLEKQELELLKLCAAARYMPCALAGKYDLPMMKDRIVFRLIKNGYIKITDGECKCYRLTKEGRDILSNAGYTFPKDIRAHKQGKVFNRRVIGAELDVILHSAGINIFAKCVEELGGEDCIYIPSLVMRADSRNKQLAGTRFYGILRIRDTAYIFYHADKTADGAFPVYERTTFSSLVGSIGGLRRLVLVVASATLEGLGEYLFPDEKPRMMGGMLSFSELLEEWCYDFCLLPMNTDAILQTKLMCIDDFAKDIAALFGDTQNVPKELSAFDAVSNGKAYITAMDMNITKVKRALEQTLTIDVTPNIICLPYQRNVYQKIAVRYEYPKRIKFTVIREDKLMELFPALLRTETPPEAARTKDGEYVIT